MLRYLIPVGLLLALVAFFYVGLGRDKQTLPSPLIGKPAPEFSLPRVGDRTQTVSSRDYAGQPYVLNVWATWCVGCRQEHDALLEIASRGEVPIVGLNWKDDMQLAQQWLRELGNPYVATAFDEEGRVAIDWGVYGAPETFLIDAGQCDPQARGAADGGDLGARLRAADQAGAPMSRFAAALCLALWLAAAQAIDTAPAFEDPALQARYERIARELRCLQCRSETIADSNASLAEDLRRELRELIAAGKSDQEIMTWMTDRYGDYVLYRPPVKSNTWLL